MNGNFDNAAIEYLEEVNSTNDYLRRIVENEGAEALGDGYTVIANKQTSGRGRLGRSFYSPENSGLYMSILLKPENCHAERAMQFTAMAAVAACEAIEEVSGRTAGIKWVNDIYMNDKKVCGILTEAVFKSCSSLSASGASVNTPALDYAILGIGFNVFKPSEYIPEDIRDIAGYIFDDAEADEDIREAAKERLAEAFVKSFEKYYDGIDYIDEYRRRSIVIGKEILIYKAGEATAGLIAGETTNGAPAAAVGISQDGGLVVRYENGTEASIYSGEISIRLR